MLEDMKRLYRRVFPAVLLTGVILFFAGCGSAPKKSERDSRPVRALPQAGAGEDSRPVIVAFGDSLTAGAGVDFSLNYPSRLQARIDAEGFAYRVVNAGVSGDTSGQGLNRIREILDLHPAIAIVELGANDGLRGSPVVTLRQNLDAIVSRLQGAGIKVILAGMRVPPNYGPRYVAAFQDVYESVAAKYDIPLIPFFLEGVGGNTALNQDDGIHPTAEGYAVVVENIWRVLQPIL
jgi:acyl-CoA thioesterase-1